MMRIIIVVPVLAPIFLTCMAQAAWHDDHKGTDLKVHFVELSGYGGDNEKNRAHLIKVREECAETYSKYGKPVAPLPPGGIPEIVQEKNIEIYYSSNRVLHIEESTFPLLDPRNCEIKSNLSRKWILRSALGRCVADLIKGTAAGVCDNKTQEGAPDNTLGYMSEEEEIKRYDAKVPPEMRARYEAYLKTVPDGAKGLFRYAPRPTGEIDVVKGYKCEIYSSLLPAEKRCIARPTSDFNIPADVLGGGIPGLLLSFEGKTTFTLQAKTVRLNLETAKSLFYLPKDFVVKNIRPLRVRE